MMPVPYELLFGLFAKEDRRLGTKLGCTAFWWRGEACTEAPVPPAKRITSFSLVYFLTESPS
jgi:hypothetical protein